MSAQLLHDRERERENKRSPRSLPPRGQTHPTRISFSICDAEESAIKEKRIKKKTPERLKKREEQNAPRA
jgi:hypothetical protein